MPWHPAQKITRADTRTTPASQVGLLQYSLQISLGTLLYSGYSGLMVYQRTYKFAHVFTKPSNIIQFSIRKFRTKMPGRQPGNGGGAAVAVAHPLRAREAAGAGEGSHIRSPSLVQRGSTGSTGSTHPDVHLVLRSITVWARGASKGTQKLNGSQVSLALCHNRPSKTTALPDARGKHVQKTAVLLKPKKLLACSMKLCIVGAT